MYKNILGYSLKKLKVINFFLNVLYFTLSFIAPIITVISVTWLSGDNSQGVKIGLTSIVVCVIIIFAACKVFMKHISKMMITNPDGSYNRRAQITKHVLLLLGSVILPLAILVACIAIGTFWSEKNAMWNNIIIISVSFYIVGDVVQKMFISEIEEELDFRIKASEDNAVELRKNLK